MDRHEFMKKLIRDFRLKIPTFSLPPFSDWTFYALCSLIFLLLLSHILYTIATYQYPEWDEHLFMDYALRFYDIISNPSGDILSRLNNVIQLRQPIYPLTLTIPLLLFGTEHAYKLSMFVNGLYFVSTVVGVYFLAKEFLNKTSSFVAALLFGVYGFPVYYSHLILSETASTTFVVYSLLFLKKSEYFLKQKPTLLFGVFFACAFLTRWTTPVFILGPLIISVVLGMWRIKHKKPDRITIVKNLLLLILFGLIIPVVFYYGPKFHVFLKYLTNASNDSAYWVSTLSYLSPEMVNTFSTRSVMFYFNKLSQQTIFLFSVFVFGFALSLLNIKRYWFFLIAFIVPYSFFTFIIVFKDDRFIVPLYPAMALISAVVIERTRKGMIRSVIFMYLLFVSVCCFFATSWGVGPMGFQGLKDIVLPEFIHHPRRIYLTPMVWPPGKDSTSAPKIIRFIQNDWQGQSDPIIVFGYRIHAVDAAFCKILCYEKRYLMSDPLYQIKGLSENDYLQLFKNISSADYFIIKHQYPLEDRFEEPMLEKFVTTLKYGGRLPENFVLQQLFPVSFDSSTLSLYKRVSMTNTSDVTTFAEKMIQIYPEDEKYIRDALEKL